MIGFTPQEVDQMGLWEFMACSDGYAEANGSKSSRKGGDIDEERLRALGIEGF